MASQDVNWDRLDKAKFFYVGVGLFSGVTTTLFPLSVIKTRQMASHNSVSAGLAGTRHVAQTIWQQEGIRGFYRGFGTVLFGTIPGRTIYMTSLEMAKTATHKVGEKLDIAPSALAGLSSFVGGAAGSLSTQAVVVPIDVVSQRLMVAGAGLSGSGQRGSGSSSSSRGSRPSVSAAAAVPGSSLPVQQQPAAVSAAAPGSSSVQQQQQPQQQRSRSFSSLARSSSSSSKGSSNSNKQTSSSSSSSWSDSKLSRQGFRSMTAAASAAPRMNGFEMARLIVRQEGIGGLYRGFWPSVCTFVPSNAIWWGAYGFWKQRMTYWLGVTGSSSSSKAAVGTGALVGVQVVAGMLSGFTSALVTNPLDLVKTRLQVVEAVNGRVPSWGAVLRELLAEEGPQGLLRGVVPRMASSALWGTAMVTTYEFLKRICALPEEQ